MPVVSVIPKDPIDDTWRYHKTSILPESSFHYLEGALKAPSILDECQIQIGSGGRSAPLIHILFFFFLLVVYLQRHVTVTKF